MQMYDHSITVQEHSDYMADTLELGAYEPTSADLDAMYADALARALV